MDYGKATAWTGVGGSVGNGGTSAVAMDSPESPSKIRDVIGQTENRLNELHGVIEAIEKRLDTVLTPLPPAAVERDNAKNANVPIASHLHGRITDMNRFLSVAIEHLHAVLNRVEI